MLLDDLLPQYDFTEIHTIRIKASPDVAFRAVKEVSLGEISGIVNVLFFLRSLPEKAVGNEALSFNNEEPLLTNILRRGFIKLAEDVPHEFVFGSIVPSNIGRVWQKSSGFGMRPVNDREFLAFNQPEYMRVVANLLVKDADEPGYVTVYTESRSQALSPQARRNFTPYWRIIRPFSGLIRRFWLLGIKHRAEKLQVK